VIPFTLGLHSHVCHTLEIKYKSKTLNNPVLEVNFDLNKVYLEPQKFLAYPELEEFLL
jgi:hypothetical protein